MRIGYHASHEQLSPRALLELVAHAERELPCVVDIERPWLIAVAEAPPAA